MKKHASLALLALLLGSSVPSSDAAPAVPPLDASPQTGQTQQSQQAQEEETESAPMPGEEESAGEEAAPAKIDIDALDSVETSRRDEEETLMPEGATSDAALLEETEPAITTKGGPELLRQAIRIRELKTLTSRDSAVKAEKDRARQTCTPEGWRTAMRNYYTVLYQKMIARDATLKEPLEAELKVKLAALELHRIYPSTLIEAVPVLPGSRSADYSGEIIVQKRRGIEPLVDESDPRR